MKFSCNKSIFQEAITTAQRAVTGKSSMPVLQCLYINASDNKLTIIGTDIDLSIETKCEATVIEEGTMLVDSRLFGDIIRKLPSSEIHIHKSNNGLIEINCNKSHFNLVTMNEEEFPKLPVIQKDHVITVPQKQIKNMIKSTIFAIAQDESRPILTGILFEIKNSMLNLVAIDGYRLAISMENINFDGEFSSVIPGKTLSEVEKILDDEGDINIVFTSNHILFNLEKTKIVSRLLEGEFIKYDNIIPSDNEFLINVKRDELLNSIERASLVAKDGKTNLVKFNMEDNKIILTSNSQFGNVTEEVNIDIVKGSELQIAFNAKYVIDVLRRIEEETIKMEFTSSVSPCIIKNIESEKSIYLVLPVRI